MDPNYLQALKSLIGKIESSLGTLKSPVRMFIAGGAAVHFHTGSRVSEDIDATFSHRILLPDDLEIAYKDQTGVSRILYLDRQYNNTFALMHEDFEKDAVPFDGVNVDGRNILVYFLSPVDLAVSKISRFHDQDIEDIKALAVKGMITSDEVKARAEEALTGYVGNADTIHSHLNAACKLIDQSYKSGSAYRYQ